uniref:Cytochrome b-c1 complex subunit 2, mitochondrial n=1 Tax=Globodera pallida TaxID=36090 RepID=A0A183BP07_GLOPA
MLLKFPTVARFCGARSLSQLPNTHEVLRDRGDAAGLSQLKNGFRVATFDNGRPTATIGVWLNAGSRSESVANSGVSALFEGLVHKGSKKRNSLQLQTELAKLGAHLRSFTSREHSAFFVECLKSDTDKVVELLADAVLNVNTEASKIEEQRAVALDRLEKAEKGNIRGSVFDNLHATAFQGTPLGLSPLGTTNSLKEMTKETVTNFVDDILKASGMVLTAVGGVDHEKISKLAEQHFGHLGNSYARKVLPHVAPMNHTGHENIHTRGYRFSGGEFHYRDDYYPAMYGAVAVEGIGRGHLDYVAMLVANSCVGKWDRSFAASFNAPSPVIQNVASNDDLLAFENFNISYDITGLFGFYIVMKGEDDDLSGSATRAVLRAYKHLAMGITEEEVDGAKNALKTNLFLGLEDNSQLANHIALEVLSSGKITPLHELERRIHFVNAGAVKEAVSRHVYDRDIAVAAIGRIEAFTPYFELRYAMSWWRL